MTPTDRMTPAHSPANDKYRFVFYKWQILFISLSPKGRNLPKHKLELYCAKADNRGQLVTLSATESLEDYI